MKRKLISILLTVSLLVTAMLSGIGAVYAEGEPEGSGTETDPYLIASASDLAALAARTNSGETYADYVDKYYKLTADIDMSGISFQPICYGTSMTTPLNGGGAAGRFSGTLDGDGHVIRNITVSSYLATFGATAGLVGILGTGGAVKNLGIEDMSIVTGNATYLCIGGIAGCLAANGMSIDRCYVRGLTVDGALAGSPAFVGGLVGRTAGNAGSITNSYTTALSLTVPNDTNRSAGIMGSCGNTGYRATNVYTTHEKIDGWAAATNSYITKTNCYMASTIENATATALGEAFADHLTAKNDGYPLLSWESTEGYEDDRTEAPSAAPTEEVTAAPTEEVKPVDPNFAGGGSEADPFLISSASDLNTLSALTNGAATASNYADKYYRLTANIDMAGLNYKPISWGTSMTTAQGARFTGTLDGDGHVIRNISIPASYVQNYGATAGLIGILGTDGAVKNLGIEDISIVTGNATYMCIGGIAGCLAANGMSIDRCYVRGMTVDGALAGSPAFVGGLVGRTAGNAGSVTNSYATDLSFTVTNDANHSAGIMGSCGHVGYKATNCYTTHAKLQGWTSATNSNLGTVNCYSAGTVEGMTVAALGEAFDADEANLNGGLPILSWEYDIQHPETATYDVTVSDKAVSDGAESVPANAPIVLRFDRDMNPDTVGKITLSKNGQPMKNLEYRLSGNVLTLSPPLEFGTRYTLSIPKTVQSVKDGEGMSAKAEEKVISFMTETALTVTEIQINGKAVSEAELAPGEAVTVRAQVRNAGAKGVENAALIVILYDSAGIMKDAVLDTARLPKSEEASLTATLDIPGDTEEGFKLGVMVWDSVVEMNAVCRMFVR